MKRKLILLSLVALLLTAKAQQNPVLMKIAGKEIKKSEFEYIYNKNSANNELDKKSLKEYVELFINFKLKVVAAQAAGLDTTSSFKNEFNTYRQQLTKPYLTDQKADDAAALEAYNRLKENVEAWHILIRLNPNATPSDTLAAYKKATDARNSFLKGEPFDKVAKRVSEDSSVTSNGGYLGYFSGFQMVYAFENAAYHAEVGKITLPIRTPYGYHLILVTNKRQDPGLVLTAHVFKKVEQQATAEEESRAKKSIDSIYTALTAGADFSKLATETSDDKGSAIRGGELGWFGTGRFIKEFEDVAFKLEKGAYSTPFRSPAGYHIILLKDKKPMETFDEKKAEIIRRLARDERGNRGVEALVEKLKQDYNFKENTAAYIQLYDATSKDVPGDSLFRIATKEMKDRLFDVANKSYTQADFVAYINAQNEQIGTLEEEYEEFVSKTIIDFEDAQLETKYPEFGNLMQEYHDGILLFEISNQLVWDKASKDEPGLVAFFETNRTNYAWKTPKYKGALIQCKDKKTEKAAKKIAKKSTPEELAINLQKELNSDSVQVVKVEKGLFLQGNNVMIDKLAFKKGAFEPSKEFPKVFISGKMLKDGPESYKDVRGPVTADYQNFLDAEWIKELRAKYPVEVDLRVLKTIHEK